PLTPIVIIPRRTSGHLAGSFPHFLSCASFSFRAAGDKKSAVHGRFRLRTLAPPVGGGGRPVKDTPRCTMRIQVYILTAALAAAPAGLLRAADQPAAAAPLSSAPLAAAAAPAGPCPQQFMTVCVREWVPEPCTYTRTTYKTECRQEAYTAYRCEVVPETKTRTVCHMRRVCETVMETRCTTVRVP